MITIHKMRERHLKEVFEIERACFTSPWSYESLKKDLTQSKIAVYLVALRDRAVIGYAGMWNVVDEGHILNIAVRQDCRRMGVGTRMMSRLTASARRANMTGLTLEVRENNIAAREMYKKFGFKQEGVRKNYYSDTGEDAIIMWKYFQGVNR